MSKYTDMHFTDEDRKKLIEHKNAIIDWCCTNIVAHMDARTSFRVNYGGTYASPRDWNNQTSNYHFGVYANQNRFYSGGGTTTEGLIGIGEKFGGMSHSLESATSPYDIMPIIDNWSTIKSDLLKQLAVQQKNRKAIYAFEV